MYKRYVNMKLLNMHALVFTGNIYSNITGQTDTVIISGVSGVLVFIIVVCLIGVITAILCIKLKQYA